MSDSILISGRQIFGKVITGPFIINELVDFIS